MANKANITPVPIEHYLISSNDVLAYLENELGFKIGADFARWTGVTAWHSYVRMRVVIAPKDIIAPVNNNNYVDKILAENAAGLQFKDHVIGTLEPFMYPKDIASILDRNRNEELQRLYQYGLYGDRLKEVVQNAKLNYAKEAGYFRIYLRPERIIADMLKDPSTGKIDGNMSIVAVHGTSSETIRWEVEVYKGSTIGVNRDITVDAIFNNNGTTVC